MEIYISNSGTKPIYEQITDQIKAAILAGKLAEGEALPSIRFLAKELGISVITTKRAYEDLEAAGFIHTVPGKGSFVAAATRSSIARPPSKGGGTAEPGAGCGGGGRRDPFGGAGNTQTAVRGRMNHGKRH